MNKGILLEQKRDFQKSKINRDFQECRRETLLGKNFKRTKKRDFTRTRK